MKFFIVIFLVNFSDDKLVVFKVVEKKLDCYSD